MKKSIISTLLVLAMVLFFTNCGEKSTPSTEENKATDPAPKEETQADPELEKGAELFSQNCATCHGEKGAGDGPGAAALNPKPRNFKAPSSEWKNGNTEEGILKTLNEGIAGSPMVAYKHLGDEGLKAIAKYVISLTK